MDTMKLADSNCRHCHGEGQIPTGGISGWRVCTCVLLAQRQMGASHYLNATLPKRALEMTIASFETGDISQNQRALDAARNFIDNYLQAREEGWVMGFWGEPRAGKTHLAVGMAQAAAKRYGARPELMNLPKALHRERERFGNRGLSSPLTTGRTCDLLVLDDFGAEYLKGAGDSVDWVAEQMYQLIDERYMNNLPTIYTTNLSPSQIKEKYSGTAWERVLARLEYSNVGVLEVMRTDIGKISDEAKHKVMQSRD